MDLDTSLDNCLQRMEAGESVASCLARYPDHAAALAPMLATASQLNVLREERLVETERVHARVVLRAALAAGKNKARWPRWGALFRDGRVAALVGITCALLFVVVTITAVADSQPGDFPYRLRIMAERTAVLMQPTPDERASAALDFAERRLTDVSDGFAADGRADPTALDALLRGMEGAAHTADSLTPEEKLAIARRVKAQAEQLHQLAQSATDSPTAPSFQAAADRAYAVVDRLGLKAGDTPSPAPSPQPALRAGEGTGQDAEQTPQIAPDTAPKPQPQKTPATGAPTTTGRPSATSSSRPSTTPAPVLSVLTATPTPSSTLPPLPATELASRDEPTAAASTGVERSTIPRRPTTDAAQTAFPTINIPAATPLATDDDVATVPPPTTRPPTTDTVVPSTKPAVVTAVTTASEPFPATPIARPSRKPPTGVPVATPAPYSTTPGNAAQTGPTPGAPNAEATSATNPRGSTVGPGQPVPSPTPS